MPTNISQLIERAKKVRMTDAQKQEQRNSFVYGNTKIEYGQIITKEMVEAVSKEAHKH